MRPMFSRPISGAGQGGLRILSARRMGLPVLLSSLALLVGACGSAGQASSQPGAMTPTTPPLSSLALYATSDTGALVALDAATGAVRWQGQTGSLSGGKPVVDPGMVYVGAGNFSRVYAFNAATGKLVWSAAGSLPQVGPVEANGVVFVPTVNQGQTALTATLTAYRGDDGARLWTAPIGGATLLQPGIVGMAAQGGVVYIATYDPGNGAGNGAAQATLHIYAYAAATGALTWTAQQPTTSAVNASFLITSARIYVYFDGVLALNPATGALLWRSAASPVSGVSGQLALDGKGDHLFTLTADGVTAYASATGAQLWRVVGNQVAMDVADDTIYTFGRAPAPSPTSIGATFVAALDGATGATRWKNTQLTAQDLPQTIAAGDGVVFAVTFAGFYALDATTGKTLWRPQRGPTGGEYIKPIIMAGAVFVGDGPTILAFRLTDGALLWSNASVTAMSFPSNLTVAP